MTRPIQLLAAAAVVALLGCGPRESRSSDAAAERHSVTLTTANFDQLVLASEKPVLVDFWATWCGPCKTLAPIVEEIAGEHKSKLVVGKLDVDQNGEIASKYAIEGLPTLLIFKDGKVVDRVLGAVPKSAIMSKLAPVLEDKS